MEDPAYRKRFEKNYIISSKTMWKRFPKTKLLDLNTVLKKELKDKEFRKYYEEEGKRLDKKTKGRRLFADRLKEDLKIPSFRKAFEAAELPVQLAIQTAKIRQQFPRP